MSMPAQNGHTGPQSKDGAPKPTALAPVFAKIPDELKTLDNWVMWKYLPPKKPGDKHRKVPFQPNGAAASSTDRSTWRPFKMCSAAYERRGYDGIGFVFDGAVGEDGLCYVGIDFDNCFVFDGVNNILQEPARSHIQSLGTYAEQSVSGTGVHCIARAKPLQAVTYKSQDGKVRVEIYCDKRYFTFTGRTLSPFDWIKAVPEAIDVFAEKLGLSLAAPETKFKKEELVPFPSQPQSPDLLTAEYQKEIGEVQSELLAPNAPIMRCPFLRDAFNTGGKHHDQGLWMLTGLASTFFEGGREIFHALSKGHADYSPANVDAMFNRKEDERAEKGLGWPSCQTFEKYGSEQCAGCQHKNKIKSPLNLADRVRSKAMPAAEDSITRQVKEGKIRPVVALMTLYKRGANKQALFAVLNENYAVVRYGGEIVVAILFGNEVIIMKAENFHKMFANVRFQVGIDSVEVSRTLVQMAGSTTVSPSRGRV